MIRALPALLIAVLATLAPAQPVRGCRYLIITPDSYVGVVRPLAEWRTLTGRYALVVPLSVTGSTPQAVRAYIRNAWSTWPVRPEYVLLACGPDQLPGYNYNNDSYYGDMTGDHLMEIPVGRLPAASRDECAAMVARILAYERHPPVTDTLWYWKGTTVVSDDSQGGGPDPYYLPDCRHVHQLWLNAGYTLAESLYNLAGGTAGQLVDALNNGRSFITYRGVAGGWWWYPFNGFWPNATWQNHARMPVIVSATCETITLAPGEYMLGNGCLRYSTDDSLSGAVAYFGTTQSGSAISRFRSAAYRGFFDAVFLENAPDIGRATLRARARVDSLFPGEQDRYVEWCLLGDPAMTIRTAPPRALTVTHDTVTLLSAGAFPVTVKASGLPVTNAVVCLSLDSAVYVTGLTNAAGTCTLAIAPSHLGTMAVTVTGTNLRPYEGRCRIVFNGGAYVMHLRHAIADPDSAAAPGDTFGLPTWVTNQGDSAADAVTATLSAADPYVTILDSTAAFGTIAPGDSASSGTPGFVIALAPTCPAGRSLDFRLRCRSGTAAWDSDERIVAGTPELAFADTLFIERGGNGNGRIDPGEPGDILVTLGNTGPGTAYGVNLTLRSYDRRLVVTDSLAGYRNIAGLDWVRNDSDPLSISVGMMVPETRMPCSLFVTSLGHAWSFPLTIVVGRLGLYDPTPDGPASPATYYAYDNVDYGYPEHPDWGFDEIRDIGTRLALSDNQTVTIDLPPGFGPFRYYGRSCSQLSICSNGWVAPGTTTYSGWSNQRLPVANGVPLIAVNWDDLYPARSGGIWYYNDTANRRFIVEWDSVHYRSPIDSFESFEFELHDSTTAAADGNNEFLFRYKGNHAMSRSTVGIQDSAGSVGMTILKDSAYHRAAYPIFANRTIKFSSDVPIDGIGETRAAALPAGFSLHVAPNPARARTPVRLLVTGLDDRPALLSVYDPLGRRLLTRPLDHSTTESLLLDISALPSGVYLLRAQLGTKTATAKLVVQR